MPKSQITPSDDQQAIIREIMENIQDWNFDIPDDWICTFPVNQLVEKCVQYGAALALEQLLNEKPQFWINKETDQYTAVLGPLFVTSTKEDMEKGFVDDEHEVTTFPSVVYHKDAWG